MTYPHLDFSNPQTVYHLRKWRWPATQVYNGFSPEERIRGWQLHWFLIENGWMPRAKTCSISGSTQRVSWHNENYYTPWKPYAVSGDVHRLLHQRFRYPVPWREVVQQYAASGEEWFAHLDEAPVDLAGQLRSQFGREIADIFANVPLPDGVAIPVSDVAQCVAQ